MANPADPFGKLARTAVTGLRHWRLRQRRRAVLASSAMVDRAWRRETYGAASGGDLRSYLADPRGSRPSPWFDGGWYLDRHPDVAGSGLDPLTHYILYGSKEGRDPNRGFATRWYLDNNPEAAEHLTPLDHYILRGAAQGRDPSPEFDSAWYAATQMGKGPQGLDPLAHYLLFGAAARAPTNSETGDGGEPVESARLECFKPLGAQPGATVLLLVAQVRGGEIAANTMALVERLAAAGLRIVLVAETEGPFRPDPALAPRLAGGFAREPRGGRYAAWAHLMRGEAELFSGAALLLAGEELAEPAAAPWVAAMLARLASADADLLLARPPGGGEGGFDPRFIAMRARALSAFTLLGAFRSFSLPQGGEASVRGAFARRLTAAAHASGLTLDILPDLPDRPVAVAPPWSATGASDAVEGPLLAPGAAALDPAALKVAFIGPWNYATGLSLASRGYLSALWRTGARLDILPVETPFHVHTRSALTTSARDFEGQADVAIVHLNPDAWSALTDAQRSVIERARVRVGLWVWEMGHVPDVWYPDFDAVDAIWTPSRYCADVFAAQTRAPISVVPHVVPLPPPSEACDRAAVLTGLGLAPDARIVLYAFDGASYIVRKNPDALVRAFAAAGLAARGWRLVLKTKNLMDQPREGAALAKLVRDTAGVVLFERQLSQEAHAALFETADIYASPHRSEGFGLTVAEAMALGKPVVATDYGGVRDFLDASCGYPVPARTVRLGEDLGVYRRGGLWGEIDEAALAQALALAAGRVEAGDDEIGRRARARIAERLSPDAVAAAMLAGMGAALADGPLAASAA
jgi:glycosyltransferase involved in cell wall biosynthesis